MLIFLRRLSTPLSYSYEAILSCGIFIFALVALIIQVPVYIKHLLSPETCTTWQLIYDYAAGGKYFTIFTAPIVIIFSILLIISNIALLRHERPRFQNFLGLLLGILLIVGEGFYYLIYSNFSKVPPDKHLIATTVINIIGITFTYVECVMFSSMICGVHAAKHIPKPDRDYILILGCGFRKDGSLPPLLRGRVDKAMEFWHKQKESTGKEAMVIPSGGQGKNECMAEADAMHRYMVASGFPDKFIIRENQSANTYQNMEFSKKIIDTLSSDSKNVNTAFVTTNYHVFRSGVWAGQVGLDAEGLGSRTKWWFWPNAFVRECVGLLYNRLLWELFYLAVLIFIFSLITRLAYL
jgi:vancomycin permeability regulator SanA